jgi:transcriptional regulator with XRE-family HTH domain
MTGPIRPVPSEVRLWRQRHGLTQVQSAGIVGVNERTWRRWENGERGIPKMLALVINTKPFPKEVPHHG